MLATVFALHAALLGLFLLARDPPSPPLKPATIASFALDAEKPAAAKPPPPTLPAKVADTFEPVVEFSIPEEEQSDAPAGASGPCSTLVAVLDNLLLDPVAVDAVRRAPPETRSIAEAIVLWNVGWSPAAGALDQPLAAVRANIEKSLAAVPDGCLDEPLAGPRLLPIPDVTGERTLFVVLGSGNWTWRALVTPSAPPAPDASAAATAPPAGAP